MGIISSLHAYKSYNYTILIPKADFKPSRVYSSIGANPHYKRGPMGAPSPIEGDFPGPPQNTPAVSCFADLASIPFAGIRGRKSVELQCRLDDGRLK